jgi:hypothetical protein
MKYALLAMIVLASVTTCVAADEAKRRVNLEANLRIACSGGTLLDLRTGLPVVCDTDTDCETKTGIPVDFSCDYDWPFDEWSAKLSR